VVITMGCGDTCPFFPGTRYLDWELEDPAGKPIDDVRRIRDQIDHRVQHSSNRCSEKRDHTCADLLSERQRGADARRNPCAAEAPPALLTDPVAGPGTVGTHRKVRLENPASLSPALRALRDRAGPVARNWTLPSATYRRAARSGRPASASAICPRDMSSRSWASSGFIPASVTDSSAI
jgi:hypothetical protein